jgi:hypothetical protein
VGGRDTNAADLLRQLRERGYQGSSSALRAYLHLWRSTPPGPTPARPPTPPTMRQVTGWICAAPNDLTDDEHKSLAAVLGACPHLDELVGHVRTFADMLTRRAGQKLNDWIRAVQADPQPQLHPFVRGLLADYDAVRAGLTLPHSSGPV